MEPDYIEGAECSRTTGIETGRITLLRWADESVVAACTSREALCAAQRLLRIDVTEKR